MAPRDWKLRVEDVLDAIARIQRYTAGMTGDEFLSSEMVQDAVIHNFTVIGEAARHVPAEVESRHPDVPWTRMRGMRNLVVHEYSGVDLRIVWDTSQVDLPPLVPLLQNILEGA